MDVNGFKGPNSEARNGKQYDIRSFKVAKFSKGCAGNDINGIGCVYQLPSYSPIKAGSDEMKKWDPNWTAEKLENAFGGNSYMASRDNYWAGAKKACDDIGMSLPDISKLESLAKKKYAEKKQLGLPSSGWFWSSSDGDVPFAYYVGFDTGRTIGDRKYNSGSSYKVLCVGD